MRYLSLCSGIEAATVAWHPLGWTPVAFAQFDPEHNYKSGPDFPSAVLAHHYPGVPNLGDMTKIDGAAYRGKVDLLVAGTPCQAFSIAGLRGGLNDARGNLTLTYVQLLKEIDPKYSIWENVPGVLSDSTNAFGCLLAGLCGASDPLVPPGKSGKPGKWPDAGVVAGSERWAAWRIIDAQGFDPQRRRRVFVVSTRAADRLDPGRVLFEAEADLERYLGDRASTGPLFPVRQSLRGDFAQGGETGKSVAGSLAARTSGGGGLGTDFDLDGGLLVDHGRDVGGAVTPYRIHAYSSTAMTSSGEARMADPTDVARSLDTCGGFTAGQGGNVLLHEAVAFGGNNTTGPIQVSTAINAHGGPHGRLDFESETFVLSGDFADYRPDQAAAAVRAKGGDVGGGSEVLVCHGTMDPCSQTELAFALGRNNGGENVVHCPEVAPCLTGNYGKQPDSSDTAKGPMLLAFSCKDHGADATLDVAPTMRAMGHSGSHANAGGQLAVRIHSDAITRTGDSLTAGPDAEGRVRKRPAGKGFITDGTAYNLTAGPQPHAVCVSIHENQRGELTTNETAGALKTGGGKPGQGYPAVCITGDVTHTLKGEGHDGSEDGTGRGQPIIAVGVALRGREGGATAELTGDVMAALRCGGGGGDKPHVLTTEYTIPLRASGAANANGAGIGRDGDPSLTLDCDGSAAVAFQASQSGMRLGDATHPTLDSNNGSRRHHGALIGSAVRRLTPLECERLQGFPDFYTQIPFGRAIRPEKLDEDFLKYVLRGNPKCLTREDVGQMAADGPRYKALGNSMNAKVMAWIGRRIAMVEAEHNAAQDLFGDLSTQANDALSLFDI